MTLPESVHHCSRKDMTRNILAGTALALLIPATTSLAEPVTSDRLAAGLPRSGDIQGEIVELDAAGARFIAIFQATQRDKISGGIVLLHDQRGNANSLEVIRPLRLGLAQAGWETLSLQLPNAARDEGRAAWLSRQTVILARLQAGSDWLKARKRLDQAIVAQGDSGSIAVRFAADTLPRELKALVLVSSHLEHDEATGPDPLGRLKTPVLDIFAERDVRPVLDSAPARKTAAAAAKDQDRVYRQAMVTGAMPGFFGLEDSLLARIRGWLATYAEPAQSNTR